MKPIRLQGPMYLYLIETIIYTQKAIKVGVTTNMCIRLKALQGSCPLRIRLAAKYPCGLKQAVCLERMFHRILASYRIHGEWFALGAAEALSIIEKHKFSRRIDRYIPPEEPPLKRQRLRNDSNKLTGKYVNWLDRYLAERQ